MHKITKYALEFKNAFRYMESFSITGLDKSEVDQLLRCVKNLDKTAHNTGLNMNEELINKLYQNIQKYFVVTPTQSNYENTQMQTYYQLTYIRNWLSIPGLSYNVVAGTEHEKKAEWYEPDWVLYEDNTLTITDVLGGIEYIITEVIKGEIGLATWGDMSSPPTTSEELNKLSGGRGYARPGAFYRLLHGLILVLITAMYKVAMQNKLISAGEKLTVDVKDVTDEALAGLKESNGLVTKSGEYDYLDGISRPGFFDKCGTMIRLLWAVLNDWNDSRENLLALLVGEISLMTLLERKYYDHEISKRMLEQRLMPKFGHKAASGPKPVYYIGSERLPINSGMLGIYLSEIGQE